MKMGQVSSRLETNNIERFIAQYADELQGRKAEHGVVRPENFFGARDSILEECTPHLLEVAGKIADIYSVLARAKIAQEAPSANGRNLTRAIYIKLIKDMPDVIKRAWKEIGEQTGLELLRNYDFRIFGWSFNRMKVSGSSGDTAQICIRTRSASKGELVPYPRHTHIDLPWIMDRLSLNAAPLALALAFSHDAEEEGTHMVVGEKTSLQKINLDYLLKKYPDNNYGLILKLGIQLLTESEGVALKESPLLDYAEAEKVLLKIGASIPGVENLDKDFQRRIFVGYPLVFGGLALQINQAGHKILEESHSKLPASEAQEFISAVMSVEIADRISDFSELHRFCSDPKLNVSQRRFRVLGYVGRMLNMRDKLADLISLIDPSASSIFMKAIDAYTELLAYKLKDVNERLVDMKESPITPEQLKDSLQVFHTLQKQADLFLAGFIGNKVKLMTDCLSTQD